MTEYSVEEVRAMASDLRGAPGTSMIGTHISLPTARAVAIYEALCAYAERIKADEWVVTDEVVQKVADELDELFAVEDAQEPAFLGDVRRILTSVWPNPPAQAEQVEDDAEARSHARMIHDFPRLSAFFQKHALGSRLPASCFACGHVGERTITHAELADVYICKTCAERIAKASAQSADPLAHPTTNSPETDSKLVGGPVAQGEAECPKCGAMNAEDAATRRRPTTGRVGMTMTLVETLAEALGHKRTPNSRCLARVAETPPQLRPPGPHNPPMWCCLPAGHDGPHWHNGGGMYPSLPFRDTDVVVMGDPLPDRCEKCDAIWPCPDVQAIAATVLLAQPAQSVDVAKVREVIAEMRAKGEAADVTVEDWADKLTAALQEKGNG